MRNLDDNLKYFLSSQGWYLGDTDISAVEGSLRSLGVDTKVNITTSDMLPMWSGSVDDWGTINLNAGLGHVSTDVQQTLLALHEYYHTAIDEEQVATEVNSELGSIKANHNIEFECDFRALEHMILSGMYTNKELHDAIRVYGDVINDPESDTHPSSNVRFNLLLTLLQENYI